MGLSSAPLSVTFEGVSDDQAPGSEDCIFDDWEVAKGVFEVFEDFIRPVDAEWVVGEGQPASSKRVLSVMQVSFSSYFYVWLLSFGDLPLGLSFRRYATLSRTITT